MMNKRFIKNLTLGAALLLSNPAWAEVCDKVRPNWNGQEVGLFGEAFNLVLSPGGIVLVIMVVLAMRFRKLGFSLTIAAVAFVLAGFNYYAWLNPVGIDVYARKEGCIGEPTLAIAIFVVLGLITLVWQFMSKRREAV